MALLKTEYRLPILFDSSCKKINFGSILKRKEVHYNLNHIFQYSIMRFQRPEGHKEHETYDELQRKFGNERAQYEEYLKPGDKVLFRNSDEEMAKELDTNVGYGMGLHTAQRLFKFNPNRINRIVDSGLRPDFKIHSNTGTILVETKGRKDNGAAVQAIKEIKKNKDESKDDWIKKESAKIYVGIVTPVISENSPVSEGPILVCDPPSADSPVSKDDEIKAVYRYYENFVILCLLKNSFVDSFLKITSQLENRNNIGNKSLPINYSPKGRVEEVSIWNKKWYGTYFDKRLFQKSIADFEDFDAASKGIDYPVYFLGVDKKLMTLFKDGIVDEILKYSLNEIYYETENKTVQISSSGIVHIFFKEINFEIEKLSRNSFELQRKAYLRMKKSL